MSDFAQQGGFFFVPIDARGHQPIAMTVQEIFLLYLIILIRCDCHKLCLSEDMSGNAMLLWLDFLLSERWRWQLDDV